MHSGMEVQRTDSSHSLRRSSTESSAYTSTSTLRLAVGPEQNLASGCRDSMGVTKPMPGIPLTGLQDDAPMSFNSLGLYDDMETFGFQSNEKCVPMKPKPKKKTTGPVHNAKYKAKLCKNWIQRGACPYYEKCQFAHGEHEIIKWAIRRTKFRDDVNDYQSPPGMGVPELQTPGLASDFHPAPVDPMQVRQEVLKNQLYAMMRTMQHKNGGQLYPEDIQVLMQVMNSRRGSERRPAPLQRAESDGNLYSAKEPLRRSQSYFSVCERQSDGVGDLQLDLNSITASQSSSFGLSSGKSTTSTIDIFNLDSA